MKLTVRNFLGLSSADIDLDGIALVSGLNGAGKSSLVEAATCAVTGSVGARGQNSKKAAADLLKLGTDKGGIKLDYGTGSVRVSYPECTVEQAGKPEALGTALGIGAVKLMALTPAERARQISERFETQPTIEDLQNWANEHPEAGLRSDPDPSDPLGQLPSLEITKLAADLDVQGWDAMHKSAKERGVKLKAKWEVVANRAFGTKIAATWVPEPLMAGEKYDLDAADAAAKQAAAHLEEMLGYAAVSAADLEHLRIAAGKGHGATVALSEARKAGVMLAEQIEALVAQRDAADAPVDTSKLQSCPHCHGKIRVVYDSKERYVFLHAAPPALPASEMAAAKAAAEAMEGKIATLKRLATENAETVTALAITVQAAQKAERALKDAQSKPRIAQDEVTAARQAAADWKRRADAIQAMQTAAGIHEEWLRLSALIDALAPEGLRRSVMLSKMAAINGRLAGFCDIAKFATAQLTDDLECLYDGRPYVLLSESERWRCDLALSCLLAQQEHARLIVADRFDVLHPQARPDILFLLRHLQIPALVCMTAKDRGAVPDLAEAGLGTTYWLESGVLA